MIRSFFEEKKNILALLAGTIVFFIYFFPYLGNTLVGLDTHNPIVYPGSDNNWGSLLGRQGGALLRKLFNNPQFSMYFAEGMALLCYLSAMAGYALLFKQLGDVDSWKSVIFFLFCTIHPIWIEQFYYTMQIFEISAGMLFLPLILFMVFQKKWTWWVGGILLSLILFSDYQTFVILYITGCILCFLLIYIKSTENNEKLEKHFFLKLGIRQVIIFLIAFVANTIISKLFFIRGDYLEGQIRWGIDPFQDCLKRIGSTVWNMLTGEGIFYSWTLFISLALSAIGIIVYLIKHKNRQEKWLAAAAYLVLQITPFLLSIYLGNTSVYRSQFNLPFTIACNVLLILILYYRIFSIKIAIQWGRKIVVAGLVFVLIKEYYTTSLLQYTTTFTKQEDVRRAYAIEQEIVETTAGSSKPVAFIGPWVSRKNGSFVIGESVNVSVFEFGQWGEPRYYEETNWIVEYMKSQGINICGASAEQVIEARQEAYKMPSFPIEGSVKELDDMIVVKLAPDDYFASEAMQVGTNKEKMEDQPKVSDQLNGNIDTVTFQDNILTFSGWVLEWQCNSSYVLPAVHLWDEDNNTLYSLSSGTQSRADLSAAFPDGTDYSHSGVLAKAELDQLPKDSLNHCRILLSTTRNGETKYFDTGKYVTDYLADIVK